MKRTTVGTVRASAPSHPIVGRPFEIEGTRRRAPLVDRDDWT
jgi:hypothetical protein